jgi:hypothetical protein
MLPLGAVLHNPAGSLGGRQSANTTMRADMVVIVASEPQHRAGMAERDEERLVGVFVAQTTVEALDIAVLLRLARRDVVPLDRPVLRPLEPPRVCRRPWVVSYAAISRFSAAA